MNERKKLAEVIGRLSKEFDGFQNKCGARI